MGLIKRISWFLTFIFALKTTWSESIEEDPEEYYGVPLGALHYSAAGTSAEVYAADEYTIVFNHFTHRPQKLGCTSMMLGPPRSEDTEDVIPGHGILIGIAQPLLTMHKRAKRQFGLWSSNSNLPRQFDHLFMEPSNGTTTSNPSGEKKAFSGIRIQHENIKKATKDITIAPSSSTTTSSTTPSTTAATTTHSTTKTTSTTTIKANKLNREKFPSNSPGPLIYNKTNRNVPLKPSRTPLSRWSNSAESREGPGIMVMNEREPLYRKPNKVHPSFKAPLSRESSTEIKFTNNPSVVNRLGLVPSEEFARRAPARRTFEENKFVGHWEITTTPPATTTPLFYVVPDPHEKRRRERLEQMRKDQRQTLRPISTTSPPALLNHKFGLPSINDKAAAFTLTNGAKITDYLWIGLYDQCEHKSVPLVSLKNIDPPREERIAPLSGWSHNVTSYRVQILNCNTILIPGFIYNGQNSTANTYFYVGVGHFPEQIEKQERAVVVGQKREDPLRSYDREDVLIRLPKGYRTFDIDFISIYNTDEKKSYGHVLIPSLLVPPCADD